jgi:hypothetical protein
MSLHAYRFPSISMKRMAAPHSDDGGRGSVAIGGPFSRGPGRIVDAELPPFGERKDAIHGPPPKNSVTMLNPSKRKPRHLGGAGDCISVTGALRRARAYGQLRRVLCFARIDPAIASDRGLQEFTQREDAS